MHTPEPWRWNVNDNNGKASLWGAPGNACVLREGMVKESDARLIAAAPDLLAVCKALATIQLTAADIYERPALVVAHQDATKAIAQAEPK
jgi:hypothetical protein